MPAREMVGTSGVTDIGNALKVLELVRANSFGITRPGTLI